MGLIKTGVDLSSMVPTHISNNEPNLIRLPAYAFVKHPIECVLCGVQTGDDSGSLVKSTCATFLKTLEECMQIASRTFSPDLQNLSPPETPPVAAIKPHKVAVFMHTWQIIDSFFLLLCCSDP